MELITIHDSEWKIGMIDNLVKQGAFTSRAEAYRAGALLVATLSRASELAKLGQLDAAIYGSYLKDAVSAVKKRDIDGSRAKMSIVRESLRTMAVITSLMGREATDDYESLADTLTKYDEVLSRFSEFDDETKNTILRDLERDLGALVEGIKEIEREMLTSPEAKLVSFPKREDKSMKFFLETKVPATMTFHVRFRATYPGNQPESANWVEFGNWMTEEGYSYPRTPKKPFPATPTPIVPTASAT